MSPSTQVILSGLLTFGAPLALAVRELFVLRRPPRGGWTPPPPSPEPTPVGPRPLPDCLIPRPWPQETEPTRPRVLEDA